MKKIDLGQTLQILANVGVIAGIVFLAAELSQNTDAMRAQTAHSFQSEFREIFNFSDSYVKATLKDPVDSTAEDEFIPRAVFMRLMRIFENQWYQYSRAIWTKNSFTRINSIYASRSATTTSRNYGLCESVTATFIQVSSNMWICIWQRIPHTPSRK